LAVNRKQLLDVACLNALLKVNLRLAVALRMKVQGMNAHGGADKYVSGYQLSRSPL